MFLNGKAIRSDFNTANADSLLVEVSFNLLKGSIRLVLHIFIGTLITKHVELLEYFCLLSLWSTADIDDLFNPEGTSTANDISHIVTFADVMDEQVSFGAILLHLVSYKLIL